MRLPWLVSDLHPHALSLTDAALRPDFQSALVADMAALNPPPVIHRYRCVFPEGAQTGALVAAGFHAVRLTRVFKLPVSLADAPALAAPLPDAIAPHWFRPGERAPWQGWLAAHWHHYQHTHQSNPPREPAGGLRAVFIGDDLIEGLALRDGPQGRVRAFGSLRKKGEIGWVGGAAALVPHVVSACLRRAAALGWSTATLEVDDDNAPLWALATAFDTPKPQTFVTWQRERAPAKRPN